MWHIQSGLKWIPSYDLVGIREIQLFDKIWKPDAKSAEWHKRVVTENFAINGVYAQQTKNEPAKIILFIKDLYRPIPSAVWWTPVPILYISRILAHEVAHHVIATRGYIFEPGEVYRSVEHEEEMSDRYAFNVIKKMKRKWRYKIGASLTKYIAAVDFELGSEAWKKKKYKDAAEFWYKSFLLDSERQDTIEWYWHAKGKLGTNR